MTIQSAYNCMSHGEAWNVLKDAKEWGGVMSVTTLGGHEM
jgi:hypothetical protein